MDGHAGRLVDDEQVLVLVCEADRDGLGPERAAPLLRQPYLDDRACREAVALVAFRPVDGHRALAHEPLGQRPRADLVPFG